MKHMVCTAACSPSVVVFVLSGSGTVSPLHAMRSVASIVTYTASPPCSVCACVLSSDSRKATLTSWLRFGRPLRQGTGPVRLLQQGCRLLRVSGCLCIMVATQADAPTAFVTGQAEVPGGRAPTVELLVAPPSQGQVLWQWLGSMFRGSYHSTSAATVLLVALAARGVGVCSVSL